MTNYSTRYLIDAYLLSAIEETDHINNAFNSDDTLYTGDNLEEHNIELPILEKNKIIGNTKCSVCLDEVFSNEVLTILPCLHVYHMACCKKWLKVNFLFNTP